MARFMVHLQEIERAALVRMSRKEHRDPRAQAALLIRRALEGAGYLKKERPPAPAIPEPELVSTIEDTHAITD